jgi:hypothetical protein
MQYKNEDHIKLGNCHPKSSGMNLLGALWGSHTQTTRTGLQIRRPRKPDSAIISLGAKGILLRGRKCQYIPARHSLLLCHPTPTLCNSVGLRTENPQNPKSCNESG